MRSGTYPVCFRKEWVSLHQRVCRLGTPVWVEVRAATPGSPAPAGIGDLVTWTGRQPLLCPQGRDILGKCKFLDLKLTLQLTVVSILFTSVFKSVTVYNHRSEAGLRAIGTGPRISLHLQRVWSPASLSPDFNQNYAIPNVTGFF